MPIDPKRVQSVFLAAVEKEDLTERTAVVDRECGSDDALRQRVEALLRAHDQPDSHVDPPEPAERVNAVSGAEPTDATRDNTPSSDDTTLPIPRPITEGPGTRIGPYKLREKIGEGGMGVVYLAEQEKPVRRKVALKIIKPGMDTEQVVIRFEAERQALAIMDHPSIARVFDAGATDTGRPYFVMELVKGVPITHYCDTVHLTPRERLELFIPVCQAIQHAHQKGIIHRDVKPSNVLVTMQDGKPVPKIIDFGIAKATEQKLTERSLFTQHGTIMGTLEYMSPEQAELSAMDVDTRTDVYALGVLLYELLTGSTPLDRKHLRESGYVEILRRIREEEPPRPSTRLSDWHERLPSVAAQRKMEPARLTKLVRGELDWIVMKAIEKDRTRRYETASGFARDIERYLGGDPVEAGPPSAGYRLRKYARKHRVALYTAAAFAAMLAAAAAESTWQALLATSARNEAQAAYQRSRENEAKAIEQEALARRSAAESEAVLTFFQEKVLSAARPEGLGGGLGKDATIRNALDAAEPTIAGSFTEQPIVEASVRDALGLTYWHLGEPVMAIRQLERAVELRQSKFGPDHLGTLRSRGHLALFYTYAGRTAEAIPLLEELIRLLSTKVGPDDPDTLNSRNNLANAFLDAGRTSDGIALHEETLKLRTTKLGPDHSDTLMSRNNLATAYLDCGRTTEAFALNKENLNLLNSKLGPDHPHALISRHNLANAYLAAGRTNEAITLHEENLKLLTSKLGPDHPNALNSRNNLASAYSAAGRTADTIAMDEGTLRLRTSRLGPYHPDTLRSRHNLANAYLAAGRTAEATTFHEETLNLRTSKLGSDHPDTLTSRNNLARAYDAAGSFARSEPILRECLATRERIQPDDWSTFDTSSQLGGSLLGQKKFAEAEGLVLQGFQGMKARESKIPAPARIRLAEAGGRVVKLYEALGQPEKAAEWRKKLGLYAPELPSNVFAQ